MDVSLFVVGSDRLGSRNGKKVGGVSFELDIMEAHTGEPVKFNEYQEPDSEGAVGGFLLYPSKVNSNFSSRVYAK